MGDSSTHAVKNSRITADSDLPNNAALALACRINVVGTESVTLSILAPCKVRHKRRACRTKAYHIKHPPISRVRD